MKAKKAIPFAVSALALATGSALAGVGPIYVCDSGGDFTTIQDAVDNAWPWDTIVVCPGTYNEKVTIWDDLDGLTIQSEEISTMGENTFVRGFKTVFAPNSGPEYVTVKGFWIGGNGLDCDIGLESSGNYAEFAFNYLTGCQGYPGEPAIRINAGNVGNNVHHNAVLGSSYYGIKTEGYYNGCCGGWEGPGANHNIHQNAVIGAGLSGGGEHCIWLTGTDSSQVHQNAVADCSGAGIRIEGGEYTPPPDPATANQVHQNVVCDSISLSSSESAGNFVHHNTYTGSISSNPVNRYMKNKKVTECPFDYD